MDKNCELYNDAERERERERGWHNYIKNNQSAK